MNDVSFILTVFEEAAHAGASCRRSEACHQTFLPEEGHQQRRIQRDFTQSCSKGGFHIEKNSEPDLVHFFFLKMFFLRSYLSGMSQQER